MSTVLSPAAETAATAAAPAAPRLFADPNVRWLLAGGAVSMLGDQFTLVALPWLVLRLTGDPLALGVALACLSLPRALLMLVGGAIVDRHSPRTLLVAGKLANAVLLATMAALGLAGALTMPVVDGLALAIGVVTAFSYPASSAILPRAVPPALLKGANAALMTAAQASLLLGPLSAGALVALVHGDGGLFAAFLVDATSFVLSAFAMARVTVRPRAARPAGGSLARDIGEALRAFWADRELRALCGYVAAVGCLVGGPIQVALPVLARTQLTGGAAALGVLMSGHGLGMMAGMVAGGVLKGRRLGTLGTTVLAIDTMVGLALVPFGHLHALWAAVAMLGAIGALAGYVQVALLTWMQRRVPAERLGRTMSLFMTIVLGLAPLAAAAAGAALRVLSPGELFTVGGLTLAVIAAGGMLFTPIRRIVDVE